MAVKRLTASPEVLQEVLQSPTQETVISQERVHPADEVLAYLEAASSEGLSSFDLRQAAESSRIRKALADLFESWADGLALRRFTHWQMARPRQPRIVNGNGGGLPTQPVPPDVTDLDPFLRSAAESGAIRREQEPWKAGRWPAYFEQYGCLACQARENHKAAGLCGRCYERTRLRLKCIEEDLRAEAKADRER